MATLEQETQQRDNLRKLLDGLAAIVPENLARADVLGKELSFEAGVPYFRRVLKLFTDLAKTNLESVPYQLLNTLNGQAQDAVNLFNEIRNFSLRGQSNPVVVRDQLLNKARDAYDTYYLQLMPVTTYLIRMGTDFEALEASAREQFVKMTQESGKLQERQSTITKEMEETLEKVRRAAAEVGVAQHAIHFREGATRHYKAGRLWLGATVILAALAVGYSLYSFRQGFELEPEGSVVWWPHLRYLVQRLLVLSIIFFGVALSSKNYRAEKHDEIVNKHRQNALNTFETFAKAAADKDTKDAVLLQATKSIFEAQSSGYLSGESEQLPSNLIIEVLRKASAGRG